MAKLSVTIVTTETGTIWSLQYQAGPGSSKLTAIVQSFDNLLKTVTMVNTSIV